MNNNCFFRYSVNKSYIHKINPFVKTICFFVYTLLVFFVYKNTVFIFLTVVINFLLILCMFFLSKISLLDIFSQLLKNKFLILFIFFVNLLTINKGNNIFDICENNLLIAVFQTLKIIFRIFKMISISNILMVTTSPHEISRCFGILIYPLKFFGVSINDITMIIAISIRFVSEFFLEISRLYKAQISRGMKPSGFFNKIKMFILIINPLFNFIFRTGNELSIALEARGYKVNSQKTYYRKLEYSQYDFVAIIFTILFAFFFIGVKLLDYFY